VGCIVGESVGNTEGAADDGIIVGQPDGISVGLTDGTAVGGRVGFGVGVNEGMAVGDGIVGIIDGEAALVLTQADVYVSVPVD
jgi:hypothetical protein